MKQISAKELQAIINAAEPKPVLLDVREANEVAICHIEGSRHIPMMEVPGQLASLDPQQPIVVICHHGMRSYNIAVFLEQQGFQDVLNLQGGIDAWAREVDPHMAVY